MVSLNVSERDGALLGAASNLVAATLAAPLIAKLDVPTPEDAVRLYREVFAAICAQPR